MTLNITLVTSSRIYQSSDFMLTIPKPYEVVSTSSTKVVQIQYAHVHGFVTYTGVGRWPNRRSRDTSTRVAEWLSGPGEMSFAELAELIRDKGQQFLRRVVAQAGPQPHTFTIAGFVNGVPSVALSVQL